MDTRTRTALRSLAGLLLAGLLLGGCGDDERDGPDAIPASADHNADDVGFATGMIPHHAQALRMVDMAEGRDLTPDVAALMGRIEAAQAPEIEQMAGWLEEWGRPVPDDGVGMGMGGPGMDGPDMDGSGTDGPGTGGLGVMPPMMGGPDLEELDRAGGTAFERMWLTMMIDHHEGAIAMSEVELDAGEHREALDLARSIIESQTAEIQEMEALLQR